MNLAVLLMLADSLIAVDSTDSTALCNNIVEIRMQQTIMRTKVDSIIDKLQTDADLLKAIREKRKK